MGERLSKTGLRPCPFCGSVDLSGVTHEAGDKRQFVCVSCNGCGATGPVGPCDDEGRAVEPPTEERCRYFWNIRSEDL